MGLSMGWTLEHAHPPPPQPSALSTQPSAVRTIGGHWLKQWTVGGGGRGEQARLEPNADIAP